MTLMPFISNLKFRVPGSFAAACFVSQKQDAMRMALAAQNSRRINQ
jgi:hypothetical protein